jgi:cytochrome c heme-lyase
MSGQAQTGASGGACPVDHKSREAWLAQARAAGTSAPPPAHQTPPTIRTEPAPATTWSARLSGFFWSQPPAPPPSSAPAGPGAPLDGHRVVSSIPRSSKPGATACPANAEGETGADAASGNWVYPSEKMFFEAMRRKGLDGARAEDMRSVVPIHNAVNERAWRDILEWERRCAGADGDA